MTTTHTENSAVGNSKTARVYSGESKVGNLVHFPEEKSQEADEKPLRIGCSEHFNAKKSNITWPETWFRSLFDYSWHQMKAFEM